MTERTFVFDCPPHVWTPIDTADASLFQVREAKAVRLHFAYGFHTPPAPDTDAYIVTLDYDLRLLPLTRSTGNAGISQLFVMPDDDRPVKIVVAYL